MKLRILDDSIRLRLSQSDVAELGRSGRVTAQTRFGIEGPALVYSLSVAGDAQSPRARLDGHTIDVELPAEVARQWVDTALVGVSSQQDIGEGRSLTLLIEKDFKCAVPRPGEENYDGFENPDSSC